MKAASNVAKHGVAFAEAANVFLDPLAITIPDQDHGDERWVTIGTLAQGLIVVVIHTYVEEGPRSATIRLISARRATGSEMRDYEESAS